MPNIKTMFKTIHITTTYQTHYTLINNIDNIQKNK